MHRKEDCDIEIGKDYVKVEYLTLRLRQHIQFVQDCIDAGFTPTAYEGRFCYIGPALVVRDLADMAQLSTDVPLSWDNLGKGFIVHPSKSTNETDPDRIQALQFLYKIRQDAGLL